MIRAYESYKRCANIINSYPMFEKKNRFSLTIKKKGFVESFARKSAIVSAKKVKTKLF